MKIVPVTWEGAIATATPAASSAQHVLTDLREARLYSEAAPEDGAVPDLHISITWEHPIAVDTLAIDRHNLSGVAVVQHKLYLGQDEQFDSGERSAGVIIPPGEWLPGIHRIGETYDEQLPVRSVVVYLDEPVWIDRWETIISDPTNPTGQYYITRMPIGRSLDFDDGFEYGAPLTVHESTRVTRTGGGGADVARGDQYRSFKMQFEWLDAGDVSKLLTELGWMDQRVWFSAYPTPDNSGGVIELMHQYLAVRTTEHSPARTFVEYNKDNMTLEEI